MEKYKFVSDSAFEAYGKDLKELFENTAVALVSFICRIEEVKPKEAEEFLIKGEDLESTMFNFLGAIITIIYTERKFFSKFEIEEVDENHIRFKISGENIKPEFIKNPVVSVIYSGYKLEKTNKGYKVTVGLKVGNEEI